MDRSKDKPVEFILIARSEDGFEIRYRTVHIQGISEAEIAKALASGRPLCGYVWRMVPVHYRIVTELGDELHGRWDAGKKAFVLDNGMLFSRKWCAEIEEFEDD